MIRGRYAHRIRELHHEYGEVVRVAPDELSFAHPQAWIDIHQKHPNRSSFLKNPIFFTKPDGQPAESIPTTCDVAQHDRMRRLMEKSFTTKSLYSQEPFIQKHIQRWLERLDDSSQSSPREPINIVDWFNFLTFDILGDLAFGESFGCIESGKSHKWVSIGTDYIKLVTISTAVKYYPWLEWLLKRMVPPKIRGMQKWHFDLAVEKISRRLNLETMRDDFMTPVLQHNANFERMSLDEIYCNFAVLIVAGSETTSTALCGITHMLCQNPSAYEKLKNEVRVAFQKSEDIKMTAVDSLPYLHAVVQEGLRMCDPTPAGNSRIVPAGGRAIVGRYVPAGVSKALADVWRDQVC